MEFKLATEVSDEMIFSVWQEGYSDYIYKFEIDMKTFVSRFIENEALREYSFIAFDNDQPIGVILGNIKEYDGIKTMRCGGFAVIPDYRSKGIGKLLLEKNFELAVKNDCKQLYLEVLKENHKAVKFYETAGYMPVYDYRFYKNEDVDFKTGIKAEIQEVSFETIRALRENLHEIHLFWQGEMFTLEHFDNIRNYAIYEHDELITILCWH